MALSRFWTFILCSSLVYALFMIFTGKQYSLNQMVSGKMNEPILVGEIPFSTFQLNNDSIFCTKIANAGSNSFVQNDSTFTLKENGILEISYGKLAADGLFTTCRNTVLDIWLPMIAYLTFFCGLLHLLQLSGAIESFSKRLNPLFTKIFPELPSGHPAFGFMTMNFAANFLGLDNAATPFGLKAMESMQNINPDKDKASNSQIMFLCLHAAGLTLIPTSIIGYRAAQHATNPADIMVPTILTSFAGTLAALILVSIRQKINLLKPAVILFVGGITAVIAGLMIYIQTLSGIDKFHFTSNLSNAVLLGLILGIVVLAWLKEKRFIENQSTPFDGFIEGAKEGIQTGMRILPYLIAMLAALSIFRNAGLMKIILDGLVYVMQSLHVSKDITQALPVALMRPFSPGGSRGFMLDAMQLYGADSFTGRLSCLFQGAAETTFYVIALYFGSVQVKNTRYTLAVMLTVDLVCVLTAILVCRFYF